MAQTAAANPPQTDGQEQVVKGLAQAELSGRIKNAAETYNLVNDLEDEQLRKIGREVFQGYQDDDESRAEWLEMHKFWMLLYMQQDYVETSVGDRDWGATESVPILTESCDQFQARTYKIFFPNDTFVSAVPMRRTVQDREELEKRADRIGKHMSYQLGFQDRSYKQDKDALFLGVAVHGSFFTKTYFDANLRRFKVDNVRPTDLVVNYSATSVRMDDLRRKTHIIYTTVGETEDMVKNEYLAAPAMASTLQQVTNSYNVASDQVQGIKPGEGSTKREKGAVLLEQHTYLDLEGDGTYLPYIATICAASRKVLRLTVGWEADQKGNPLDEYKQVQYFTHYKYAENPDGFYGLGLGHKIGDLNSATNIMLRQSLDAATLANDGNMSGFISESLGLVGEEIRMEIGKLRKIPAMMGDMQNGIMLGKFPGPNAALIQLMEVIDTRAQRLGSVNEATTGASEKVVQPTTYLAQIEQSLEQFSAVQMRLSNSLSEELQKIYSINKRFLPFIDYFVVNGVPESITRADYADDMLVQPIFDPKYATQQQKVARAQAELQATLQNPVNQSRPQVLDAAFRRVFEAMDVEDIDELIPPQPQIENLDDQLLENMYFLMPKEARPLFDVFPEQNHLDHLQKLQELQAVVAQFGIQLTPDQAEDIFKHQQKHQAYLYGAEHGLIQTTDQTGQTPTPPMASRQDDSVDPSATTANLPPDAAALLATVMGGAQQGGGAAASPPPDQPAM